MNVMKLKNIFMLGGALLFGAMALTSCSDDETYDFDGIEGIRVYMDKTMQPISTSSLLKTPVGVVGGMEGEVNIKTTSLVQGNVSAQIAYDDSFVDKYNAENNSNYKKLPTGSVVLEKTTLTVTSDTLCSENCKVSFNQEMVAQLKDGESYLIPIVLTNVNGPDVRLARDDKFRVRYFALKYMETESLMRINPTSEDLANAGSPLSNDVKKAFTVVSSQNMVEGGYSSIFAGGWYGGNWDFINHEGETGFVLDMGEEKEVSAFNITCYVMSSFSVAISTDNSNWINLGSTAEANTARDDNWNDWYVLYAPMPARYLRYTIELDPNSYYWQYASWGYAGIMGLGIMAK